MEFVPMLVLVALNKKAVDFIKELLPNHIQNKLVQAIAWLVGVVTVFLFAESDYATEMAFGEHTLATANTFTIVIIGFFVGSSAGVLNDFIERRNPDADPDPPD